MADFCAACTREGMPGNDFLGWRPGTLGYGWALCEGCGTHVFGNAGEPACAPGGQPGLTGLEQCCPLCQASAPAVVLAALWVLLERCCDHDPGQPCPCHEQASADVAALATAGLLTGSTPASTGGGS